MYISQYDNSAFLQRVLDIYNKEESKGVVVSMGGQIPNNLALPLYKAGIKVMGTCPTQIDKAEDREKFSRIIDQLGLEQAEWRELADMTSALKFADKVSARVCLSISSPELLLPIRSFCLPFDSHDNPISLLLVLKVTRNFAISENARANLFCILFVANMYKILFVYV